MAEMVNASDCDSDAARLVGSNPTYPSLIYS